MNEKENRILLESTHIHHGSFQDIKTFLDPDGNQYDLQKSNLGSDMPQSDNEGKGQGEQNEQRPNQKPPEPKFETPKKGQMFRDIMTGKTYKWNGKDFIIQR